MEALLAESFLYTGGMGGSQGKQEWLAGLAERRLGAATKAREQKTAELAAQNGRGTVLLLTGLRAGESNEYGIEVHGNTAVVNRRYAIRNDDGSERCLRYVRVYQLNGGRWQLVSHRYIHALD
jgi:hypothetical protein